MKFEEIWPKGFRGEVIQRRERTSGELQYSTHSMFFMENYRKLSQNYHQLPLHNSSSGKDILLLTLSLIFSVANNINKA